MNQDDNRQAHRGIGGGHVMGGPVFWNASTIGPLVYNWSRELRLWAELWPVADETMLERDTLASGSTSKAAGGIRTPFADELNIRIALRSLDEFERFGADISFRQYGYLFLLTREEDVAAFRAALALQQSLGVPSPDHQLARFTFAR